MAKKKGNDSDNKEKRLMALEQVLEKFDKDEKKPSAKQILAALKEKDKKFVIGRTTLYEDMTRLAINDPFVKDLASKSYSKIVHDCFDSINFVERKAREILEKEWTIVKTITKTDDNGNEITETHTTKNLKQPHLKAMQLIKECAGDRIKLLGGDIIKISAKKWSLQRQKDIQTITELTSEIRELKKKSTSK
jgi:hypothetical protein